MAAANMSGIDHVDMVEDISTDMLAEACGRRDLHAIVMDGGSPSHPMSNTSLHVG